MAIKGTTRNIALNPQGYKDLNPEETFIPYNVDLRNGRITDGGNWEKRPGFADWNDVGIDKAVNLLIPIGVGYAVTDTGKIFELNTTPTQYDKRLTGHNRPTWDKHKDLIILCDGGHPVKIEANNSASLSGSPPRAKFIARISSYSVMAGHHSTEFKWSASGNPENYLSGDSGFANLKKDGSALQMLKMYDERLYFFKNTNIECWYNRGGSTPFVRLSNYSVWDSATEAGYSVVKANNGLYWFDKDGDFKQLVGNKGQVISKPYRAYLDGKIKNPKEVYGYDCRKENSIRWFSPTDGICVKFDYLKNHISEDNTWQHGQFERLIWNSYMELDNEQYFGAYDLTGKVYHWSKDYLDDNGSPVRVYRDYKVKLSENGNSAVCNQLKVTAKRGVATDSELNPKLFLRYRFDEGRWSNYRYLDLGSKGDRDAYMNISRLGTGKEIEIEVIETDAVDYLLKEMKLTIKEFGV